MPDLTSIAGLVIAIISAVGGLGACAHFKMKSNCCSCLSSECWDNGTERKASTSTLTQAEPKIKITDI
jgi:hypothetical protein